MYAQNAAFINYQAVVRDVQNQILTNKDISLKFIFLQNGIPVFMETDNITTTAFGVVNTKIGDSNPTLFKAIPWGNGIKIRIALDANQSNMFVVIGQDQDLGSTPIAQFAFVADSARFAPGDNWGTQAVKVDPNSPILGDGASNLLTIKNDGIANQYLANNAVSSNKIQDGTILEADLSDDLKRSFWKKDSIGNIYRDTMAVSIGTNEPVGLLTVKTANSSGTLIYSEYRGNAMNDIVAVKGYSAPQTNYGIGGDFTGGYYGVRANGLVDGTSALIANANGASNAGVFNGNVTVSDKLSVNGHAALNSGLDVFGNTSTSTLETTNINLGNIGLTHGGSNQFQVYQNGSLDFWTASNTNGDRFLNPGSNGSMSLGSSNYRWKGIYFNALPLFDAKNVQWNPATGQLGYDNSSRRFKENITPLVEDFAKILDLLPVRYTRSGSPDRWEVGFIAEEADSLGLKPLVEYDATGQVDGFNYEKALAYVVPVLRQQKAEIEALKAKVQRLEALEERLSALDALRNDLETLKNK
jgi:hypothetical protein